MPILTPVTDWIKGPLTVALLNSKVNDRITELQTAVWDVGVTKDWTNITLGPGYVIGGDDSVTPQYRIAGGMCELRGAIGRGTNTWGASAGPYAISSAGMPAPQAGYGSSLWLPCYGDGSNRVPQALNPRVNGQLILYTGSTPPPTVIYLDGARYSTSQIS